MPVKKTSVRCPGCDRTQEIGIDKLIKADYYTCSLNCKKNPNWIHPRTPEGNVHYITLNAAAGFVGHTFGKATNEDIAELSKCRIIIQQGLDPINKEF